MSHVFGPFSEPTESWTFDVRQHPYDPIVADGTVYIAQGGDKDESNVVALSAATGSVQWGVHIDPVADAAPAVLETHVLVPGRSGKLYAIARETGELEWTTSIGSEDLVTPVFADGLAVVGSREHCYGVDPVDGTIEWKYPIPRGMSIPCIGAGGELDSATAFFHSMAPGTQYLHAVDVSTGERVWRIEADVWPQQAPAYRDGTVFLSGPTGGTRARRATDGELLWSREIGAQTTPAVTADSLYLRTQDKLHALSPETGDSRWMTDVEHFEFRRGVPAPTVTEQTVIVPEKEYSDVAGYDREDGSRRWMIAFPDDLTRPVSVVDGRLIAQTHSEEHRATKIQSYSW